MQQAAELMKSRLLPSFLSPFSICQIRISNISEVCNIYYNYDKYATDSLGYNSVFLKKEKDVINDE